MFLSGMHAFGQSSLPKVKEKIWITALTSLIIIFCFKPLLWTLLESLSQERRNLNYSSVTSFFFLNVLLDMESRMKMHWSTEVDKNMTKCDLGITEAHNKSLAYGTATAGGDRKTNMSVAGRTLKICLQTEILSTDKNNCKIILSPDTLMVEILGQL